MATRQLLVGILALFLVNQSTATPVSAPKYAQVGLDTRDMKPTPKRADTGSATCEVIFQDATADTPDSMYKVTVGGDWATEDAIKTGVQACGSLEAWIFQAQDGGKSVAGFEISGLKDDKCVPKAIESASSGAVKDLSCPVHNGADRDLELRLMRNAGGS